MKPLKDQSWVVLARQPQFFHYLGILGLLVLLVCHRWFGPDLWFHIAWGRSIIENWQPVPEMNVLMKGPTLGNQYWLFQVMVSALFELGGHNLIAVAYSAVWVVVAIVWIQIAQLRQSGFWGLFFLLVFVSCVQLRFEYRPETSSFLYLSLFLLGLNSPLTKWSLAGLFLIEVLWVNSHSYFIFGPMLALGYGLFTPKERGKSAVLFGLMVLATFISPFGYVLWESIGLTYTLMREIGSDLEELTPTYLYAWWIWPMPIFWLYFAFIFCVSARCLLLKRNVFAALVGLAALVLGLRTFRFIPMCMILTGPILKEGIWLLEARTRELSLSLRRAAVGALMTCVLVFSWAVVDGRFYLWTDSGTTFGLGLEWAEYPIGAVEFLKKQGFSGKLFNLPTDGGYLEYHLPAATITCDSGYTDAATAQLYFKALNDPQTFEQLDRQFEFAAILTHVGQAGLVSSLLATPKWITAYSDSHRLLFLRRDLFGHLHSELNTGQHNSGEDLRRYSYRSMPEMWLGLAISRTDRRLAEGLIGEFQSAPHIPSSFVKLALEFALATKDQKTADQALALYDKIFWEDENRQAEQLAAKVRQQRIKVD